ncbi:MAG: NAD(P)H-hydrate dehydratase [Candidatus Omnitrophica bacterium]|nr:NAD(P)H-hydrate dehydratase [Candidatus Omnitrophota bacterium]
MFKQHIEKIPSRKEDSHKGSYGKVLVLAGSRGMTGASYLTAQGALLSGSGLVTCGVPLSLNVIMETKLTEVMTLPLSETPTASLALAAKDEILKYCEKCDVVAIGPGLGKEEDTIKLVKELVLEIDKPVVLDADGINAIKGDVLTERKGRTVITPHLGEMANLIGKDVPAVRSNREYIVKSVAESTGAIVCLKGHKTLVADPEGNVYENQTGNSGMATGGTGDVLTGMITSFIGQGVSDYSAVISAVYLHGLAGDIALDKKGPFSLIASDILENLPATFNKAGI